MTNIMAVDDTMQQKVKRLESEVEEFQRLAADLEKLNKTLQAEVKELKTTNSNTHTQ